MGKSKTTNPARDETRAFHFPPLRDHLLFWPIVAAGLVLDLWSKWAVFKWLENEYPPEYKIIPNLLSLIVQQNPGAAFGLAAGKRAMLIAISIVAVGAVTWIFISGRTKHVLVRIAMAMFLAGILGNLYDRIFHNGLVRDFIDAYYQPWGHWPTFNVADSMLCIAVGLLLLSSFIYGSGEKKTK